MITAKEEKDSGFDCPAIGNKVPRGYELVKGKNGRWELRRKDHAADRKRTTD